MFNSNSERQFIFKHFHSKLTGEPVYNCKLSDIIEYDKNEKRHVFVNTTAKDDFHFYLMKTFRDCSLNKDFVGDILDQYNFQWNEFRPYLLTVPLKNSDGISSIDLITGKIIRDRNEYFFKYILVSNEDDNSAKEIIITTNDILSKNIKEIVVLIFTRKSLFSEHGGVLPLHDYDILGIGTVSPVNEHVKKPTKPIKPEPKFHWSIGKIVAIIVITILFIIVLLCVLKYFLAPKVVDDMIKYFLTSEVDDEESEDQYP